MNTDTRGAIPILLLAALVLAGCGRKDETADSGRSGPSREELQIQQARALASKKTTAELTQSLRSGVAEAIAGSSVSKEEQERLKVISDELRRRQPIGPKAKKLLQDFDRIHAAFQFAAKEDLQTEAKVLCETEIENRGASVGFLDSMSAEFGRLRNKRDPLDFTRYVVLMKAEGENAFGARLRKYIACELHCSPEIKKLRSATDTGTTPCLVTRLREQ